MGHKRDGQGVCEGSGGRVRESDCQSTKNPVSTSSSSSFFFFFCKVFLVWTVFKVLVKFVTILLLFSFLFFFHEACGILTPDQGSDLHPLHWKSKS